MTEYEWGRKWPKKKLQGAEYDLSHLNPFPIEAVPRDATARRIPVGVSFSLHTFTVKREDGDAPDTLMVRGSDVRTFCTKRHKCSLHLPGIIRGIAAGNVFRSRDRHGNWNWMTASQIDCAKGQYACYFQLDKSFGKFIPVRMRVISAHERSDPHGYTKEYSFYSLVRQIAETGNE